MTKHLFILKPLPLFHYPLPSVTLNPLCPPSLPSIPSGEVGFRAMSESLGWAKRPMLQRVHLLPPSMPLTLLYGSRSWVDSASGDKVAQIRVQTATRTVVRGGNLFHLSFEVLDIHFIL